MYMNKSAGPPILNEVCFFSSSFNKTMQFNFSASSTTSKYADVMIVPPFLKDITAKDIFYKSQMHFLIL